MTGTALRGKGKAYAFLSALVGHAEDECVIWPFAKNHKGYGLMGHDGRFFKAHRLMCEMVNGKPPTPEHQATHKCGHPSCVNPMHLEWKTNYANQMDRAAHGTMPKHGRPARILTPEQIAEVRALKGKVAQYDLAARFGVKPGCIEYWQSHDKPPKRVTDDQVRAVRAAGATMSQADVVRTLGISKATVQKILSGASFRDVA